MDIQYTKDKELIIFHDPYLDDGTDLKAKHLPRFKDKWRPRWGRNGIEHYLTCDFTLDEMREVHLTQRYWERRGKDWDNEYVVQTLQDVIDRIRYQNEHTPRTANGHIKYGMYIEVKEFLWNLECLGVNTVTETLRVLRENGLGTIDDCKDDIPVILHSFELDAALEVLAADTDLPFLYCTNEYEFPEPLQRYLIALAATLVVQIGLVLWPLRRLLLCKRNEFAQGESAVSLSYKQRRRLRFVRGMLLVIVTHWQLHEAAYEAKYANFYPMEDFGRMFHGICPDLFLVANDNAMSDPRKFWDVHWQEWFGPRVYSPFVKRMHDMDLVIHPWTHRSDDLRVLGKTPLEEIQFFRDKGVDGIMTEWPGETLGFFEAMRCNDCVDGPAPADPE